jgi:hypothetical protein
VLCRRVVVPARRTFLLRFFLLTLWVKTFGLPGNSATGQVKPSGINSLNIGT